MNELFVILLGVALSLSLAVTISFIIHVKITDERLCKLEADNT